MGCQVSAPSRIRQRMILRRMERGVRRGETSFPQAHCPYKHADLFRLVPLSPVGHSQAHSGASRFPVEAFSFCVHFGSNLGWKLHKAIVEVPTSFVGEWIWAGRRRLVFRQVVLLAEGLKDGVCPDLRANCSHGGR
jgi:hypothetical protein